MHDWKTGSAFFKYIGTEISLHPNAKYRDLGITDRSGLANFLENEKKVSVNPQGGCNAKLIRFPDKSISFEVEIVRLEDLNKYVAAFVGGHEEGHALQLLGQSTALYRSTQLSGLTFPFFSEKYAVECDMSAYNLISGQLSINDYQSAWRKGFNLEESIANICGLVALIKSGAEHNLILSLKEKIDSMKSPYQILERVISANDVGANRLLAALYPK